jgi:hypothetical protein
MRGRPQDWLSQMEGLSPSYVLTAAGAAGFDGVWLDRFGDPAYVGATEEAIPRLTMTRPLTSRDGRYRFAQLSDFTGRLRSHVPPSSWAQTSQLANHPPVLVWGEGFGDEEFAGSAPFRWMGSHATLEIDNPLDSSRLVLFRARAQAPIRPSQLALTLPDGRRRPFHVGPAGVDIAATFEIPAGHSTTDAPEADTAHPPRGRPTLPSSLRLQLVAPSLAQVQLLDLMRSAAREPPLAPR